MFKLRNSGLFLILFGLISSLVFSPNLQAATITVNTNNDEDNSDGDCSLREAIISANDDIAVDNCTAGSGDDEIVVPQDTYVLDETGAADDTSVHGDLDILENVTITGQGSGATIDATGLGERVLHIKNSASHTLNVTIQNITFTGGSATDGGGLYIAGRGASSILTVTLDNCNIVTNEATNEGGGIYIKSQLNSAQATVNINNSAISNNTITGSTGYGGGIFVQAITDSSKTTFNLQNSTVSSNQALASDYNYGGGIALRADKGDVTANITDSTISENIVNGSINNRGAGVFVDADNGSASETPEITLNITNSMISMNQSTGTNTSSGGGLSLSASEPTFASTITANLTDITISDNIVEGTAAFGGGIYLLTGGTASLIELNINGTTISTNTITSTVTDAYGAGLYAPTPEETINITNSTISGNAANAVDEARGGGIYLSESVATLAHVTIASNKSLGSEELKSHGGGIYIDTNSTLKLFNSIIAYNASFPGAEVFGNITETANSIILEPGIFYTITTGTVTVADPLLSALADNGGPTLTQVPNALGPANNAIDIANCIDASGALLTVDQRGFKRDDGDGKCTTGAYEIVEREYTATCSDSIDNDQDGLTDADDPDCTVDGGGGTDGGGTDGGGTGGGGTDGGGIDGGGTGGGGGTGSAGGCSLNTTI